MEHTTVRIREAREIPDAPAALEPPWWPSLEELLPVLRPRLERILYRYGIPAEDAPDLVQETLLVLCHRRSRIRDPEAWIVVTLRNRCRMYWRSRRSKAGDLRWVVSSELVATLAETRGAEALLGKRLDPGDPDLRHDLARALARLPEPWAEVVRLRIVAGCSDEETARATPYQASSIRKIFGRARRRLGALLAGEGGYPTTSTPENDRRRPHRRQEPPVEVDLAQRLEALERRQVELSAELAAVIAALRRPSRGVAG